MTDAERHRAEAQAAARLAALTEARRRCGRLGLLTAVADRAMLAQTGQDVASAALGYKRMRGKHYRGWEPGMARPE